MSWWYNYKEVIIFCSILKIYLNWKASVTFCNLIHKLWIALGKYISLFRYFNLLSIHQFALNYIIAFHVRYGLATEGPNGADIKECLIQTVQSIHWWDLVIQPILHQETCIPGKIHALRVIHLKQFHLNSITVAITTRLEGHHHHNQIQQTTHQQYILVLTLAVKILHSKRSSSCFGHYYYKQHTIDTIHYNLT